MSEKPGEYTFDPLGDASGVPLVPAFVDALAKFMAAQPADSSRQVPPPVPDSPERVEVSDEMLRAAADPFLAGEGFAGSIHLAIASELLSSRARIEELEKERDPTTEAAVNFARAWAVHRLAYNHWNYLVPVRPEDSPEATAKLDQAAFALKVATEEWVARYVAAPRGEG